MRGRRDRQFRFNGQLDLLLPWIIKISRVQRPDNPRLLMEDLINAIGRFSGNTTSNIVELRYYMWQ